MDRTVANRVKPRSFRVRVTPAAEPSWGDRRRDEGCWFLEIDGRRVGAVCCRVKGEWVDPATLGALRARLAARAGFPLGARVRAKPGTIEADREVIGTIVNRHLLLEVDWEKSDRSYTTLFAGDEIRDPKRIRWARARFKVLPPGKEPVGGRSRP